MTTDDTGASLEFGEFDVDAALPEAGTTTLLEASAGTGKTWAIAALVARYVIEEGMPLERLLVVTFGRAASQELRSRVRERLVEAERRLDAAVRGRVDTPDDDLLVRLLRGDADTLRQRRARARAALTDFDAATIATIHQFCHLVLRGLGVAGDTDARAELVEDLQELREQVVDDLYAAEFADHEERPPLSRAEAGVLARRVVEDPQAVLRPEDHGTDGLADVRVRFAHAVREEMQVRKRRLGVLGYDDLLSRLADVLCDDDSPARDRMRQLWKVVLVDEFQDTDPVQWQVFHRAFSGHAAMVLIGDPKQAIYAFRGGDIATYTLARDTAARRATLAVNHRSDAPLVDAVTAVLRGARLGDGIVVREVRAHHRDGRLTGAPSTSAFRLRLVNRQSLGSPKPPAIGVARPAVAADLARDVAALLEARPAYDGRPLRAEDVAVLCSTAAQCQTVHEALAAAAVPSVVLGSSSVFGSQGALDWLVLLEALEQPHRSGRVRAAALTALLGHTAEEIVAGGDELTQRLADRMRDWAGLLRERGVAAVLEVATTQADDDGRALGARLLVEQGGERLLTDVRHVGEVLHDVASREGLQLPALLAWLRTQIAETRRETPDDRSRRLDSDARAVQVLTVHKSKGLQFPVVYLPFVSDASRRKEPIPLFHDSEGVRSLDVSGDAGADHRARAESELSDEELRLLYVAMTRARSQLVTWWFASLRNIEAAPLHRMLMGRRPGEAAVPATAAAISDEDARARADQWASVGGPAVELVRGGGTLLEHVPTDPSGLALRRWHRTVDNVWRRTSYTGLSRAAEAYDADPAAFGSEPEVTPKQDEPTLPGADDVTALPAMPLSPMAELPVGATFGSLVHAVLEHADPQAPDHGGDLRAELLEHIEHQRLRWPVAVDAAVLADALVQVHDTPLGPLVGDATLGDVGVRDRLRELDFELPLAGGDRWTPGPEVRLSDLAGILRAHLPQGDPLLPYADTLEARGYDAQELRGYLTGSIDVVLRAGGRFVVVDYKTNYLGPWADPPVPLTAGHYAPDRLAAAMTHSSYPLQALLYAVVLHRFLRWRLSGYVPEEHLGGVMYVYLRGLCGPATPVIDGQRCGVFSWRPPIALVDEVSDLLDGSLAGADVGS
ncbi:MAG: exodeoxyribonuclease beta subunit [Nocardioidaceae bacterium]|nr:exodeoxyribonuclease beta subunit [Nocardioidaceae bacterium]